MQASDRSLFYERIEVGFRREPPWPPLRSCHVQVHELGPYLAGLRQLEAAISYPLDDGREQFRIDHGPGYADFFSGLGEAHFAIACDGDQVVGALAGVLRLSRRGSRELASVYLADLKVAAAYRGKGLGRDLLLFAVGRLREARFRRWRLAFGAAMRGARGDVMNSARGFHPARLALARLHVYFVPPQQLARLPGDATLRLPPGECLTSPQAQVTAPAGFVSTAGRKDLRLLSTGEPWPPVASAAQSRRRRVIVAGLSGAVWDRVVAAGPVLLRAG